MQQKWFRSWFNSPYYHILYSGRDDAEAEFLIDNLTTYLHPEAGARILDIACGKGRHAIYLRKKGFDVTGIDLSENSIKFARKAEDEKLHFLCTICVNCFILIILISLSTFLPVLVILKQKKNISMH